MRQSLDLQIRSHMLDYLADRVTLAQFLEWFLEETAGVEDMGDPGLEGLVYTIKLYWAEYTSGDLTEEALRTLLHPLVETFRMPVQMQAQESAQ